MSNMTTLVIINACCTDASKGFGGKFGLQEDGQDKTAVGYEYKEKLAEHSSQKGLIFKDTSQYINMFLCFSNLFFIKI